MKKLILIIALVLNPTYLTGCGDEDGSGGFGTPGEKGQDGKDGSNGKNGSDGSNGRDGKDGDNGSDGNETTKTEVGYPQEGDIFIEPNIGGEWTIFGTRVNYYEAEQICIDAEMQLPDEISYKISGYFQIYIATLPGQLRFWGNIDGEKVYWNNTYTAPESSLTEEQLTEQLDFVYCVSYDNIARIEP